MPFPFSTPYSTERVCKREQELPHSVGNRLEPQRILLRVAHQEPGALKSGIWHLRSSEAWRRAQRRAARRTGRTPASARTQTRRRFLKSSKEGHAWAARRQNALCGVVGGGFPCYDSFAVPKSSQSEAQSLLAGNVRRLRENLKWTQEQAAEASGIAVRHFQKIEAGDVNVTVATLVRVAEAFRFPVKALFEEKQR